MRQVLLLLAFLISGAIPLQAQTARSEVKILIEIRPEVNYVTHLYTLAELGFSDSTYAVKYGNTFPKAAIDTLQKYKKYLTFGQGEADVKTFCQIFDSLSKDGISDPAELYRKGVKEYLKQLLWQ